LKPPEKENLGNLERGSRQKKAQSKGGMRHGSKLATGNTVCGREKHNLVDAGVGEVWGALHPRKEIEKEWN